jgi:Na+:H+ antiporter, NhaA family
MATDIAFALGILSLFGNRVTTSAKVFLTSLAIIDDVGAVIVIAVFYSKGVVLSNLGLAIALVVVLILLNKVGVKNGIIYGIVGFAVWLLCLGSGIHASVAGVVVAATIPVWSGINPDKFREIGEIKLQQFSEATNRTRTPLIDQDQEKAIHELHSAVKQVQPPMMAMQHAFHPVSTFIVMPLFALLRYLCANNQYAAAR